MKKNLMSVLFLVVVLGANVSSAQQMSSVSNADKYWAPQAIANKMFAEALSSLQTQMLVVAPACEAAKSQSASCTAAINQMTGLNETVQNTAAKVRRRDTGHFTPAQEKRIVELAATANSATESALISADQGKSEEVVLAAKDLKSRMGKLEAKVGSLDMRVTDHDEQLEGLQAAVKVLQDSAVAKEDPELAEQLANLSGNTASADKQLADRILLIAERVQVMENAAMTKSDSTVDKAQLDAAMKEMAGAFSRRVASVEAKAENADAKAERAMSLARTKNSTAIILEVAGMGGAWSPFIKQVTYGGVGAYLSKGWLRLGGSFDPGLAYVDGEATFAFTNKLEACYAWKYAWLGVFSGSYALGLPYSDSNEKYGFSFGAIARFVLPMGNTNWFYGLELYGGPAYESKWVPKGPPAGAAPGAVYDDEEYKTFFKPFTGGVRVFIDFNL